MQEWLNKLKIAIAEDDIDTITQLFAGKISGGTQDELIEAAALTKEAIKLVESKKNALAPTLKKIQTAKEFFRA